MYIYENMHKNLRKQWNFLAKALIGLPLMCNYTVDTELCAVVSTNQQINVEKDNK